MKKRKTILTILLVVFLAIFIYAAYNIIETLVDYQQGEETYDQLQQFVDTTPTPPPVTQPTVPADPNTPTQPTEPAGRQISYPVVDFDALHEINPNVTAWIAIEGTNINYPVVLGNDNQYYVKHMINGKYNKAGSIFMDYRNHADFMDKNTILYGHNMKNDTMFADITNYKTQEYYAEHPIGLLVTPDGNFYFEIIAAYVTKVSSDAWKLDFDSDAEALAWAQKAMGKSEFVSSYTPTEEDVYITLSTCSYEFNNARYVLVGVIK